MTKKFVDELKVNEQVDSCFVMTKKDLKLTKHDKPYLDITLSDRTGRIEARLWDDAEKFNEAAETGDVVRVKGTVDKYREEKQLKLDLLERADDRAYRFEDMVRVAENRDEIYAKVTAYLEGLKNPWLKKLAAAFLSDEKLMKMFREGLGGKMWHGAYVGGLLEHTYEVMFIADNVCGLYPDADRDVAIFGSFIHDIGKVRELDVKKMEYTVEGGLLGHIAIGYKMLAEKISAIADFPRELSLRIEHIMLSHHGKYEQQSPVLPKTLEATIIYQADELVSQANAVKELQKQQAGEGKEWSSFVTIKGRKYFIKDAAEEGWKGGDAPESSGGEDNDLFG